MGFINRSYVQPLTLAEIAAAGNVSPKYISEFFKAKTGVRLVSYINALRIEKARQTLIERPELSIAEVAAACGFEEPSYFAKLFRRATGFTPKEHRNVSA